MSEMFRDCEINTVSRKLQQSAYHTGLRYRETLLFVILMRLAFSQEPFRLRSSGLSLLSLSGSERQSEREREEKRERKREERERERQRERERERGGITS